MHPNYGSIQHYLRSGRLPKFAWYFAELVVIGVTYFLLAKLGLKLASINPSASPIWPPTGFALAAILLRDYRVWPALFVAALLANLTTAGTIYSSAAIASGNMLEALVGGYLIKRWCGGCQAFDHSVDVAKFAMISVGPATLISATVGVGALRLAGYVEPSNFGVVWMTWWMGDFASALLVTPVIVLWAVSHPKSLDREELAKSAAVFVAACVVGLVAFGPIFEPTAHIGPLGFLAVAPLIWAALHRGPRDTATVGLILSILADLGTAEEVGSLVNSTLNDSFLVVSMFVIGAALPSLALSADVAARKQAKAILRESEARLKAVVEGVIDGIITIDEAGTVLSLNPAAVAMFDRALEEVIGHKVSLLMPELATGNAKIIGTGREVQGLRKDGTTFPVDLGVSEVMLDGRGVFIGIARDISERKREEERQRLLIAELDHRVKNTLASVVAVMERSRPGAQSIDAFMDSLQGRIQSMSRAHSRLSRSRWTGVGLRQLVDDELQPYGMTEGVALEGPDLVLTPDAAQSVTMAIHELATNAAKYGALSSPVGRVWVHWEIRRDSQAASTVCLVWHESGGPPVLPPQRDGFGMNVIRQILPYDLGARVDVKFARGGLRCEIVIPLARATARSA